MSETHNCPKCETPLPADAPEGTCPRCLLAAGLESADGGATGAAPDLTTVAEQFPELEVLSELGRGGMGVVYKARQKNLERLVALKVLPREIVEGDEGSVRFEERFTREARALARLSHPNIVGVHEFGEREGVYYFLMEYVDGANLRQAMRTGDLTPVQALAIVPQICDALQYAHDQGVVHRDIKPENVLLDKQGTVKIADFGLAKLMTKTPDDRTLTRQGLVMGTPHYMAPEQIEKPDEVDHRADIYSLGVVLYEMLTGELPIGRFAPPSEKVRIDVRLDEVVLRALEKDADRRYQAVIDVKTGIGEASAAEGAGDREFKKEASFQVGGGDKKSRRSSLAMWAFLLPIAGFGLSVVLSIAATLFAPERTPDSGSATTARTLVMGMSSFSGVAVLVGLILAVVALVRIQRSGGRLHGTGFAIAALVLPLLCCLPGVGALWMATLRSEVDHPAPIRDETAQIELSRRVLPSDVGDLIHVADRTVRITLSSSASRADLAVDRRGAAFGEPNHDFEPLREGQVFVVERIEMRRFSGSGEIALHIGDEVVPFGATASSTLTPLWSGRFDVAAGAEADVWLDGEYGDVAAVDVIGRLYRVRENE